MKDGFTSQGDFWSPWLRWQIICLQCRRSWVRKIPRIREWQPAPVFLPGECAWTEEPGGLQSMGS